MAACLLATLHKYYWLGFLENKLKIYKSEDGSWSNIPLKFESNVDPCLDKNNPSFPIYL